MLEYIYILIRKEPDGDEMPCAVFNQRCLSLVKYVIEESPLADYYLCPVKMGESFDFDSLEPETKLLQELRNAKQI